MNKNKKPIFDLDAEEQKISDAMDRGEFVSVENLEEEKEIAERAAANYFKKTERINIRLSRGDLQNLKKIAELEGLPYQTLISSVLHKYAGAYNEKS